MVFQLVASSLLYTCPSDVSPRARCSPGFASCTRSALNKQELVAKAASGGMCGVGSPEAGDLRCLQAPGLPLPPTAAGDLANPLISLLPQFLQSVK